MPVGGSGKPAGGYRAGKKGSYGCDGYPTVSADGTVHGCHPTKSRAQAQARAIWASTARKSITSVEKSMVIEGDFVMFSGEEKIQVGRVEYVMTNPGMLGLEGSEYALEYAEDDKPVIVRLYEEEDGAWEETEEVVYQRMSEVVKIESLSVSVDLVVEIGSSESGIPSTADSETIMEIYNTQIGKAEKPNYEDMIKPRRSGSTPSNPKLYARVVQAAKDKFDVYPSAVANSWVVQEYKRRGGTYKAEKEITKGIWDGGIFDPRDLIK
jgi:hypothetical protein